MSTLVQSKSTRTLAATSLGLAFDSNVTAGNFILVIAGGFRSTSFSFTGVTDTLGLGSGNGYALLGQTPWTATFRQINAAFLAKASSGGANTVTMTVSAAADISIEIYELSGIDGFDQCLETQQTSATPLTGSLTNTKANSRLFASVSHDGADTTITPASGWTQREENESTSGSDYSTADKVVSSAGSQSHQWALGASRDASMLIVCFAETTAGGGGGGGMRLAGHGGLAA